MGAVNLDSIEARLFRAKRRITELFHKLMNLIDGKCAGRLRHGRFAHR